MAGRFCLINRLSRMLIVSSVLVLIYPSVVHMPVGIEYIHGAETTDKVE